jgi:arylsulfatase A-like enzyme
MKFANAHVTDSVCVPSRTFIMTGRYAFRFGKPEPGEPWRFVGLRFPTTQHNSGKIFQPGYATGYIGKWVDIAGITIAPEQAPDPVSCLSILKGPAARSRNTLVTRGTRSDTFRDGDWKLILEPGSGSSGPFFSAPKSGDAWKAAIEAFGRSPLNHDELEHPAFVQLFNPIDDPGETSDLSAENPDPVKKMLADYQKIIRDGRSTPGPQLHNDRDVKAFRSPTSVFKKRSESAKPNLPASSATKE